MRLSFVPARSPPPYLAPSTFSEPPERALVSPPPRAAPGKPHHPVPHLLRQVCLHRVLRWAFFPKRRCGVGGGLSTGTPPPGAAASAKKGCSCQGWVTGAGSRRRNDIHLLTVRTCCSDPRPPPPPGSARWTSATLGERPWSPPLALRGAPRRAAASWLAKAPRKRRASCRACYQPDGASRPEQHRLTSVCTPWRRLNLNGIAFMGCGLSVGRPSAYSGPSTPACARAPLPPQLAALARFVQSRRAQRR